MKKIKMIVATVVGIGLLGAAFVGLADDEKAKKKTSTEKKYEIIIKNGDTTVNGKPIDQLSKSDRAEFKKMQRKFEIDENRELREIRVYAGEPAAARQQHRRAMAEQEIALGRMEKDLANLERLMIVKDEEGNTISINRNGPDFPRGPAAPPMPPDAPGMYFIERALEMEHDNSAQYFAFKNGDTDVSVRLSKASNEELKNAKIAPDKSNDINMMPNPASNEIVFSYNFNQPGAITMKLYDAEGKVVKTENISDYKGGKFERKLNLSEIKEGVYYIEFTQGENKITRRLSLN